MSGGSREQNASQQTLVSAGNLGPIPTEHRFEMRTTRSYEMLMDGRQRIQLNELYLRQAKRLPGKPVGQISD